MNINNTEIWKQASEVYAEVSDLPVKQALAYIYGIKNITIDVRKAVITLINSGSQASRYLQDNITPGFEIFNIQTFKVGQKLDEYELLEEIGHGGMSQVFKAKRINGEPQTHVAIKVFAPRNSSSELLQHFINEQKILAQLSHVNIVKMLHGGTTADNVAYLVMELIADAETLDVYCQNNNLTSKQCITLINKIADALAYSHANLIIHRDLKPDNILIDKSHELKIVDFGIAKLINNDLSGNKTTIMALTPSYAAPEQVNSQPISIKTDIFSLAVVTLSLLTEQIPLPKDRLLKSCAHDEEHLDRVIKSLKCDKDLKNILTKALAQNPEQRYASMQSFAYDLKSWLADKPVNATSKSFYYQLKKFAQRRSALFATLVSFLVFMFIGSFLGYQQYKQIQIEANKAKLVKQFMLDSFTSTNPDLSKGVDVTAKDLLANSAKKLASNTKLDSQTRFELLQTLGFAYGAIGVADKAVDLLQQSLQINPENSHSISYLAVYMLDVVDGKVHEEFLHGIDINKFSSNSDKARVLRAKSQVFARNSQFDKAMDSLNQAIALNHLDGDITAELLAKKLLAEFYLLQSQPQKGIDLIKELLTQVNDETPITLAIDLRSYLGTLYNDIGKYELALIELQQAIIQIRTVLGDFHSTLSKALNQISGSYRALGDLAKAQEAASESYRINLKIFGEHNVNTAISINSLAVMAYQRGDYPKAIELMQKAVNILEQLQTPDYADTLELKTNLAALLTVVNRNEEALILLREIYAIQTETLGATHDSTIYSQQILARTLSQLGQMNEALKLAQDVDKKAQKSLGAKHPLAVGAKFTLANIYKKSQQNNLALDTYLELYTTQSLPTNHPKHLQILQIIAGLYAANKDIEQAEKFYLLSIQTSIENLSNKHLNTLNAQLDYAEFLSSKQQNSKATKLIAKVNKIIKAENIQNQDILTRTNKL